MKKEFRKLISLCLAAMFVLSCAIPSYIAFPIAFADETETAKSSDDPTISAVPGTTVLKSEEKDGIITVTATIQNIDSLKSFKLSIDYDTAYLELEDYDVLPADYSEKYFFGSSSWSVSSWGSPFECEISVIGEMFEKADIAVLNLFFSRKTPVFRKGAKFDLKSTVFFNDKESYTSDFTLSLPAEKVDPEKFKDARLSGDIDGDGSVTVADARRILRLAVDLDRCTAATRQYADTDGNDEVSVPDARIALRVAVQLDKTDVLAYFLPIKEEDDDGYYYDRDIVYISLSEGEKKTLDDVIVRKDSNMTWKSSNPAAVSVTQNGVITAVKKGFSCIILSDGKDSFYYEVTVKNKLQDKIDELRNKYPAGYYWNNNPASKKYPAVTETPCTDHASGAYSKCKGQCAGFGYLFTSELFVNAKRKFGVTWDTVKIGDYLRLKPHHSVVVIDTVKKGDVVGYDYYDGKNIIAESNAVSVVHCNWDMRCGIRWDDLFYDDYTIDSSNSFSMY